MWRCPSLNCKRLNIAMLAQGPNKNRWHVLSKVIWEGLICKGFTYSGVGVGHHGG